MNLNLEEINKEYVQLNNDLKKIKSEIDDLKVKVGELADDKAIQKGKAVEAKRKGDTTAEKTALNEIERIENEVKTIIEEAKSKQEKMKSIQTEINEKIEKIKQNSDMKEYLDDVIAKKHEREIPKLEKEKEEVQAKKGRLENLQQLVKKHPSLENNLKGTLIAKKEITNLEKELKDLTIIVGNGLIQYKDPARANEIMNKLLPEAKNKLETNKKPLMTYITKKGLDITEQDINDLASTKFAVDHKGNLLLNDTINKNLNAYNRQIKGYDKSIRNHQIALDKLGRTYKANEKPEKQTTSQYSREGQEEQEEQEEPKLKWYQKLTQIFKNLKEKRKQKALPEATSKLNEEKEEATKNDFRNSMKYDIVKDIVDKMKDDSTKEAKASRKAEAKANKEEENERD